MFEAVSHTLTTPLGTLTFDREAVTRPRAFFTRIEDDLGADREIVRYPEQDLSYVGDAYANARILTCSGVVQADTQSSYMTHRQAIRGAVNRLMREDGVLKWTPYGFPAVQMTVRRYEKPQVSARTAANGMLLSLVAADPRVYAQASSSVELAAAPNTGFTSPFTGPITPTGSGADTTATNAGDTDTYPTTRIYGPATNPVVLNITTGEQVVFSGLTISDGDYVEIVHAGPSVRLNGSELASRYSYIDASSTEFFALRPGANDLRFVASSTGLNTRAVVEWNSAWLP